MAELLWRCMVTPSGSRLRSQLAFEFSGCRPQFLRSLRARSEMREKRLRRPVEEASHHLSDRMTAGFVGRKAWPVYPRFARFPPRDDSLLCQAVENGHDRGVGARHEWVPAPAESRARWPRRAAIARSCNPSSSGERSRIECRPSLADVLVQHLAALEPDQSRRKASVAQAHGGSGGRLRLSRPETGRPAGAGD